MLTCTPFSQLSVASWLLVGLLGLIPGLVIAQSASLSSSTTVLDTTKSRFGFRISAGANAAFACGKGASRLKQEFVDRTAQNDSVITFQGKLLPRFGGYVGVEVTYLLRPTWYVGAGLRFSQIGYVQEENILLRHPYYQYDQLTKNRLIFRVNVLEVPLQLSWLANKQLRLNAGFSIGGPVDFVKQQIEYQHSSRVFINGVEDVSQGTGEQVEQHSVAGHIRLIHFGYLLGVSYQVRPHWWVQIGGQMTTAVFQPPQDVSNIIAQTGLTWQL